ncbi:MAG TPA: hypothetical protein PLX56_00325 [bacterium]|nr:hypothetical protein [bacterium]HQN72276.1 hypothetical protein [bacterium]HQO90747.1 hypothetical protein [bacterium]
MQNRCSAIILFFSLIAGIFSSCNLSQDQKANIVKILEIRESLVNSGDVKSLEVLMTEDFPDKKEYLDQMTYRYQYFLKFSYDMNTIDILSSSVLGNRAHLMLSYDLSFRNPDDVAETFWLDRKEDVIMVKEKIGWKIADIKEMKNTGRKIDPQTVHDIFFALDTRKTALNNGDHELFSTIIWEKYPDREKLVDNFKKNASAFINVNYGLKNRKFQYVSPSMDEARVIQYFDLVFNIKGFDAAEKIEDQSELISLKKMPDNTWKITDGLK